MNLERLKDIDFDKQVFVWEDLDFNVRASRAGHVLCRCYRFQQVKVNGMKTGGCTAGVGWGAEISQDAPNQVPQISTSS